MNFGISNTSMELVGIIALVFLILTSLILNAVTVVKCKNLNKKIEKLTKSTSGDDVLDVVNNYYNKIDDVVNNYNDVVGVLKYHDKTLQETLQKVYVHRYNPYKELGGNLSWVMGVLDNKNNGYLINTVYHPEGSQMHCREIVDGKCKAKLLQDEETCLQQTIAIKN